MTGEYLDTVGDLLYQRSILHKTRGLRRAPDVRKSAALGRQYFGKIQAHAGMLPAQVTQYRKQAAASARPYK